MTTILAVKRNDQVAIAGDGQVTMGEHVIMKHSAKKVRTLYHGKVVPYPTPSHYLKNLKTIWSPTAAI